MIKSRYTWRTFATELALLAAAFLVSIPFVVMTSLSLKTQSEAYLNPLAPPDQLQWANYGQAWNSAAAGLTLGRSMFNSVVITVGAVVCVVVLGSLAAYALARWESKVSTVLYFGFVLALVLPPQLALIPVYRVLHSLGIATTHGGMILLWTAQMLPLTVFLYVGFIRALPKDYEQAAQVDGARFVRRWLTVVFPLLNPVTGTVAVLVTVLVWNDLFTPLAFLSGTTNATVTVAVFSLANQMVAQWNIVTAAVAISLIPVLFIFVVAQRQLIRGFSGGIRG